MVNAQAVAACVGLLDEASWDDRASLWVFIVSCAKSDRSHPCNS